MYEAIAHVKKILKLVIKRESHIEYGIISSDMNSSHERYNFLLDLSQKILNEIHNLQEEHRVLKRPFIYD